MVRCDIQETTHQPILRFHIGIAYVIDSLEHTYNMALKYKQYLNSCL